MVDWLTEDEFSRKFDLWYRPQNLYLTEQSLISHITRPELHRIIPLSPVSSIGEDDDGLGPREIWFASLNRLLLLVTHYLAK